jgi:hypothetical protein
MTPAACGALVLFFQSKSAVSKRCARQGRAMPQIQSYPNSPCSYFCWSSSEVMDKIQTLVAFKNDMLQLGLKTRILAKFRSLLYAHLRQLNPQLV